MSEHVREQAVAVPPPPYRAAAWYDPRVEHRPCECPRCRGNAAAVPRRLVLRTMLVVAGGVVLPAVSLLVNASMQVVALGLAGTTAILLSMAATLLHVILSPCRKELHDGVWIKEHHPPSSSTLRLVLLGLAALSCLTWGYLALLFLPLVPLSVIGIIFAGIGLCGLCPYGAVAIASVQVVRDYRAVRDTSGSKQARNVLLLVLLTPPLLASAAATLAYFQRAEIASALSRIERQSEGSVARYRLIVETLKGKERRLVDAYLNPSQERQAAQYDRRALIAATYRDLTDETIDSAVAERGGSFLFHQNGLIRPFAFLQGCSPLSDNIFRMRF